MVVWSDFKQLSPPSAPSDNEAECFSAAVGATTQRHWVARDFRGYPCLVVEVPTSECSETRLEHLRVQVSIPCEVHASDQITRATLTVLRCTSDVDEHQRLFVSLVDPIVAAIGQPATASKLAQVIQQLVSMFSSLSRPARTTVQGLWGELLVIAGSREPLRLLRAWHATTGDDFDFSEGRWRLEVKTTGGQKRVHTFSLTQLRPVPNTTVHIVSLIVRPAGGGSNIATLVSDIERFLDNEPMLRLKLHTLVVDTLGAEWKDSADRRFDRELAANSLTYYCSESIPQLSGDLPIGVSHVSFVSDLSRTPAAPTPSAASLLEAATPAIRSSRRPPRPK